MRISPPVDHSGVIVGAVNAAGFIISEGKFTPVTSSKYVTYLSGISSKNQIIGYFYDRRQEYFTQLE